MPSISIEKNTMVSMGYGKEFATEFYPLEVSSSNFQHFDRKSNTGGEIARENREQFQPPINRIFEDASSPSHLLLPVIDR